MTVLQQQVPRFLYQMCMKGHHSAYSSVKTWVDTRRTVPLRIEKYDASGKVIRRINTTRILLDGSDSIPADLKVYGPSGSVTANHRRAE